MMPPKFDGLFMFIMFSLSYLLDVNPQFCQTHPISHQGNSAGYPRVSQRFLVMRQSYRAMWRHGGCCCTAHGLLKGLCPVPSAERCRCVGRRSQTAALGRSGFGSAIRDVSQAAKGTGKG